MTRTRDEARDVLTKGGDLVDLGEAIGTVISDPTSSLDDIRLGLRYGGVIGEQAALALQRRSGIPTREFKTHSSSRDVGCVEPARDAAHWSTDARR
jgi:hypothetical protein